MTRNCGQTEQEIGAFMPALQVKRSDAKHWSMSESKKSSKFFGTCV